MNKKIGLIPILMLLTTICFPTVFGDGGIIGPPQIYIQEKAQNAIVAWNGFEEVLILSVDIQSSESTKVLRVIPLPSNPSEVKEGSFESFTKLQEIINDKLFDLWNRSIFSTGGKAPHRMGSFSCRGPIAARDLGRSAFQETYGNSLNPG